MQKEHIIMAPPKTIFNELPGRLIPIRCEDGKLDFESARDMARNRAAEQCDDPMLLAWYDGRRNVSYPDRECGPGGKPAWIQYAESRGADLSVDINDGQYVFLFLGLD